MSELDDDGLRGKVRDTLLKVAPNKLESLTRETDLVADLAYHSLAILEAIFTLEEEIGIELVDYGDAGAITTVGDVEDYVIKVVAQTQES